MRPRKNANRARLDKVRHLFSAEHRHAACTVLLCTAVLNKQPFKTRDQQPCHGARNKWLIIRYFFRVIACTRRQRSLIVLCGVRHEQRGCALFWSPEKLISKSRMARDCMCGELSFSQEFLHPVQIVRSVHWGSQQTFLWCRIESVIRGKTKNVTSKHTIFSA